MAIALIATRTLQSGDAVFGFAMAAIGSGGGRLRFKYTCGGRRGDDLFHTSIRFSATTNGACFRNTIELGQFTPEKLFRKPGAVRFIIRENSRASIRAAIQTLEILQNKHLRRTMW